MAEEGQRWTQFYVAAPVCSPSRAALLGRLPVRSGTYGTEERTLERSVHSPPLLYHLGEDPGERFDVAEQYPDVVAELVAVAERFVGSTEVAPSVFDLRPPE